MPQVSIIIPTYQRARLLGDTLIALLAQTLTDWEIIVADDGSTDDTPETVAHFRDNRVRYLRCGHLGMPQIWNQALPLAQGEYLMTCHDHDVYNRTLLAELGGLLDRYPTAVYAHCGIIGVDASGAEVRRYMLDCPELMCGMDFLVNVLLPGLDSKVTALTMFRRAAIDGLGLDPSFGEAADVEFWMRLACLGDVAYTPKLLIGVRERDQASQLYYRGARMADRVLAAKRRYLPTIKDPAQRRLVEAGWHRAMPRLAFAEWLRISGAGLPEEEDFLLQFIRREGGTLTARLLWILSRLPSSFSRGILRAGKRLTKFQR